MSKVFEDAFMELQKDMIDLCYDVVGEGVDGIYVYCSNECCMLQFDVFFAQGNKVVHRHQLKEAPKLAAPFLSIGIEYIEKIGALCKANNRPAPTEIKLIYDVKNCKLRAAYQYAPVQTGDIIFDDLFEKWAAEVEATLNTTPQNTASPEQIVSTKKSFLERLFGKK